MELKAAIACCQTSAEPCCFNDEHSTICLTCSGKRREDLMDLAEVVEVLAKRHIQLSAVVGPFVSEAQAQQSEIEVIADLLNIWPAVEKRARELEEER